MLPKAGQGLKGFHRADDSLKFPAAPASPLSASAVGSPRVSTIRPFVCGNRWRYLPAGQIGGPARSATCAPWRSSSVSAICATPQQRICGRVEGVRAPRCIADALAWVLTMPKADRHRPAQSSAYRPCIAHSWLIKRGPASPDRAAQTDTDFDFAHLEQARTNIAIWAKAWPWRCWSLARTHIAGFFLSSHTPAP